MPEPEQDTGKPYGRIVDKLNELYGDQCRTLGLNVEAGGAEITLLKLENNWTLNFQQTRNTPARLMLSFRCVSGASSTPLDLLRQMYVYRAISAKLGAEAKATFSARQNWNVQLFTIEEDVLDKSIFDVRVTDAEYEQAAKWLIEKAEALMGKPFKELKETLAAASPKQSFSDFVGEQEVLCKVKNDLALWYLTNTGRADKKTDGSSLSQEEVESTLTLMQEQMETAIGSLRKNDVASMEKRFETWLKAELPFSASGYMSKLRAYKKASSQHDDVFLVQTEAEFKAFWNKMEHDEGWQTWLKNKSPDYASDARSAFNKYNEFLQKVEKEPSIMNTELPTTPPKETCRNWIIFGAPGTGKSHLVEEKQKDPTFPFAKVVRVTFHPEYSYHDFVGSYKPVMVSYLNEVGRLEKKIEYQFVPGPFAVILKKARKAKEKATQPDSNPECFLLIIEEINRARMAAVFGDVFQLLDRNESGESDYDIVPSRELDAYLRDKKPLDGAVAETEEEVEPDPIKIPANMYIWATMNSADQGVFPMDTAFKRRWDFKYLGINEEEGKLTKDYGLMAPAWNRIRMHINGLLQEAKINEDKQMGPFFLKKETLKNEEKFIEAFKSKVVMYLYEDAAKHKKDRVFAKPNDTYSQICGTIKDLTSLYAAFCGMKEALLAPESDTGKNEDA